MIVRSVIVLCCAALFVPLALPLVTGRVFVKGDFQAFNLPIRFLYQEALRAGDSLLWTPAIFSGVYLHGEGQVGMFHPLHLLLYYALPLQVAFNLEMLASYVLALAGFYRWMRRLDVESAAAWFGAMLFAFSGFTLLHYDHLNLVAVFAHGPWLLVAVDMVLISERGGARARAYAALTLVVVSQLLLGFPQGVWLTLLAAGVFTIFRRREWRDGWRVAVIAAALATAGLIGAIQLLPSADMFAASIRPGLPPSFALEFSLHPYNLLQYWSPYVFVERVYSVREGPILWEFGIYSGAVLIVALPWLWIRREALAHRRGLIAAAGCLAVLCVVLALGEYGGLYGLLTRLPVLQSIRAPTRHIATTNMALMVLATVAFADLVVLQRARLQVPLRRLWPLAIPALLSIATLVALNARWLPAASALPLSTVSRAAAGTGLIVLVTGLVALAASGVRWALPAIAVVTALDIGVWGMREVLREPAQTIASLTASAEPPSAEPAAERLFKSTFAYPGNILVLRGYRLTSGYVALPPRTYFHYTSSISKELAATQWDYGAEGRTRYPNSVERARLVADARFTRRRFGHDWNLVDLHKTALVDRHLPPLSGPPGSARIISDRPGYIVVDVTAPGTQLLSVSERFHAGWKATANGRSLETVAIHGDFLGCLVEAGTSRVEFRFRPESFTRGLYMSAAGVVALAAAFAWLQRRTS